MHIRPHSRITVEVLANVTILLSSVVVFIYFLEPAWLSRRASEPFTISAGDKLALPLEAFSDKHTFVLVLRRGCRFCSESVPFYRNLTDLVSKSGKVSLMAVLPEPVAESRRYLEEELHIVIGNVRQAQLASAGVPYTPTLLLIDRAARVQRLWVGKLSGEQESEVIRALEAFR